MTETVKVGDVFKVNDRISANCGNLRSCNGKFIRVTSVDNGFSYEILNDNNVVVATCSCALELRGEDKVGGNKTALLIPKFLLAYEPGGSRSPSFEFFENEKKMLERVKELNETDNVRNSSYKFFTLGVQGYINLTPKLVPVKAAKGKVVTDAPKRKRGRPRKDEGAF